jgi:hypothetical protein
VKKEREKLKYKIGEAQIQNRRDQFSEKGKNSSVKKEREKLTYKIGEAQFSTKEREARTHARTHTHTHLRKRHGLAGRVRVVPSRLHLRATDGNT